MSDRLPLHDYSHSRAVVMGTWDYTYLPAVPAAANSVQRMVSLLTGPLCGWPEDRVTILRNRRSLDPIPDQLITEFEQATDVAMFYYVGHGQIDTDDQLCLALGGSRTEANRRAATSLPFQAVRRALLDSPANTKILILDCCFAGLANRPVNTLAALADDVLDKTVGTGAYTMTATSAYATAWYENDPDTPRPQTFFTKYLADLVEAGVPGMPPGLRLHQMFSRLRDNLARDQRPVPNERIVDAAREFVFAYNAAPTDTHVDPDVELQRLADRLAETEVREQALQAEAAGRKQELERLLEQARNVELMAGDQQRQLLEALQEAERRVDETTAAQAAVRVEYRDAALAASIQQTVGPNSVAEEDQPAGRWLGRRRAARASSATDNSAAMAAHQATAGTKEVTISANTVAADSLGLTPGRVEMPLVEANMPVPTAIAGSPGGLHAGDRGEIVVQPEERTLNGADPGQNAASSELNGSRGRRRPLLLITLLTVTAVMLSGMRLISSVQDGRQYQRVEQLATLGSKITALAAALETERDETITYIALPGGGRSSDPTGRSKVVPAQLSVVRQQIKLSVPLVAQVMAGAKDIGLSYPMQVRLEAQSVQAVLGSRLTILRNAAVNTDLPALAVIQQFTTVIDVLLAFDDQIDLNSADPQLAGTVQALSRISRIEEEFSVQRGIVMDALTSGMFGPGMFTALNASIEEQAAYDTDFQNFATTQQSALYTRTLAGSLVDSVTADEMNVIDYAQAHASRVQAAIVPATWFGDMTETINRVRLVERDLVGSAISRSTALGKSAIISVVIMGVLLVVLVLLFTVVVRPLMVWAVRRGLRIILNSVRSRGLSGKTIER
jgi:hypothetical protein